MSSNHQRGTVRTRSTSSSTVELIVKRGALRRFDRLKQATAELPVTVTWDRRLSDRREGTSDVDGERRRADRRQKPPFTWETADFVVVEKPEPKRRRARG